MMALKPLFQGQNEIDQLFKIFSITGTPNKKTWPEIMKNKFFKETLFPKWNENKLEEITKSFLEKSGLDLLKQMLECDPSQRITARRALEHPFFDDLDVTKL